VTDPQLQLGFDDMLPPESVSVKSKRSAPKKRTAVQEAPQPLDLEALAALLAQHPDYKVLRRLKPELNFATAPVGEVVRILVLDTETTGLEHSKDKIIELAMLQVDVDLATGLPVGVVSVYDGLEDPGVPISKEIEAITGINSAMVAGHRLDEARIASLLQGVDLVIAHNAAFDRPFCEARIPAFAQLPWGCSFADIEWKKEGQSSAKLEYLALDKGWFYDAHRAEVDCHALLAVLGQPLTASKVTGLAKILDASQGPSYRLQATNAPFEAKDLLKARAYRWNAEQRVWQTRVANESDLAAEYEWLKASVYTGRAARVQVEKLTALEKYSSRAGELSMVQI
jgi:DNA polymerase-3 subunit epsilon